VVTQLTALLAPYIRKQGLGVIVSDIDTPFGREDVRRPDLLYFSNARLHLIVNSKLEGPPDLCVEVLSPSNRHVDRGDKFKLYRDSGVPFYWILDPILRSIEAFRLESNEYVPTVTAKGDDVVRVAPFEAIEIALGEIWWPTKST
jgi:Uma2 family endonuclease